MEINKEFIIGLLHFVLPLIYIIYLFFAPVKWDPYMFIWFNILTLHWILFNNECIISYIHKKLENPNYKMGEDVKVKDMINVFTKIMSEKMAGMLVDIINYGTFIAIFIRFFIFKSIKPIVMVYMTLILFGLYNYFVRTNLIDKYPLFKAFISIIILYNLYLIYKYNIKK